MLSHTLPSPATPALLTVTSQSKRLKLWFSCAGVQQGRPLGRATSCSGSAEGHGVANDMVEAVRWYQKAADGGLAIAQYNLGVCYKNGNGVTCDMSAALHWLRAAAAQGHTKATELLSRLPS